MSRNLVIFFSAVYDGFWKINWIFRLMERLIFRFDFCINLVVILTRNDWFYNYGSIVKR